MQKVIIKNQFGSPDKFEILGIRVTNISIDRVLDSFTDIIKNQKPHQIVPVNPEMIITAQTNSKFKEVLNNADLLLPDGIGVVIASKILGHPIKNRITGVDTVKLLASIAKQNNWKIFLLGAAIGVAEKTKLKLETDYPGIQIVGTYAGSPHQSEEDKICGMITTVKPDILLVAYGAPKQELWVARNLKKLNVPLVMCVGGTFDFIAEVSRRAPKWMQNTGTEWLFRLINEPWRWRRMLALPRFAIKVIEQRLSLTA